jgi:hypothetical protein
MKHLAMPRRPTDKIPAFANGNQVVGGDFGVDRGSLLLGRSIDNTNGPLLADGRQDFSYGGM